MEKASVHSKTIDEEDKEETKAYRIVIPNSKFSEDNSTYKPLYLKMKLKYYESIVDDMKSPENGCCFKDRKDRSGINQPLCCSGEELYIWANKMNSEPKFKGIDTMQDMIYYGYLIPMKIGENIFYPDDHLYTFQVRCDSNSR
jgi:hypothetical protein